jgi:peptidyl-prolyl cis-trans isomerase D
VRLLQAQNMTPTSFENSLRRDLLTSQVAAAMAESSLASSAVAKEFARLRLQQREVSELLLPLERFAAQIKPDDAAIAAFYEANAARFKLPEQVQVEFVELSLQNISAQESISAEDVKAFYDANYGSKFKERSEARAKAEALLAELRRSPDRFAELAKQNSQDSGS